MAGPSCRNFRSTHLREEERRLEEPRQRKRTADDFRRMQVLTEERAKYVGRSRDWWLDRYPDRIALHQSLQPILMVENGMTFAQHLDDLADFLTKHAGFALDCPKGKIPTIPGIARQIVEHFVGRKLTPEELADRQKLNEFIEYALDKICALRMKG